MIAIDTNVLIRYFVGDDKKQCQKATKYLENNCAISDPSLIISIALCEVMWVLQSAYENGNADFSDYFIANIATKFKANKTVTFDKRAGKYELFELI